MQIMSQFKKRDAVLRTAIRTFTQCQKSLRLAYNSLITLLRRDVVFIIVFLQHQLISDAQSRGRHGDGGVTGARALGRERALN